MKWACNASLFIGIALLTLGCRARPDVIGAVPVGIECSVFYRASQGGGFQEASVTLTESSPQGHAAFDKLALNAQFVIDVGEGRSLAVWVSQLETDDEIARQLYQVDPANGLVNQFVGGHGFTGLNYVYLPDSTAEMQYFCEAR